MRRTVTIVVLLAISFPLISQDEISYAEQLKALEEELDSLSIFNLIDSLFDNQVVASNELNLRLGFTTNVTSAGRDYNISQSGYSPGISYYHKSGLYGDLTGYWNNGVEPNYNPTILSAGYLGSFKNPKWGFSIDAERWFFNPNDSSDNPLLYSLGGSMNYDFKIGFASLDYSFLFGEETANRIIANVSGNIPLGKWWIFKDINLYPSASVMIGNSQVSQIRITERQISNETARQIVDLETFENLTDRQRRILFLLNSQSFNDGLISEEQRNSLRRDLFLRSEVSDLSKTTLEVITSQGLEIEDIVQSDEFGILNYSFTLPLSLSTERFYFLFSYTYSIPIQLPDEYIKVDPVGFFAASISYRIPFK